MRGFLFAALMVAASSHATAQGTTCYPLRADSIHATYRAAVRNYASDSDSVWAAAGTAIGFPRVTEAQITLSSDKNLCKTAAQKFAANVPSQASSPPSGKVYVFKIGTTHYYVADPDYWVSPTHTRFLLFNSNWVLVARLGA
jgi:hypothetical protein